MSDFTGDDKLESFGDRIRIARRRANLTQQNLAQLIGAHRASIVRWEKGNDIPSFLMGCRLARALGVNALWLAGLTDSARPGIQFDDEEQKNFESYKAMTEGEKKLMRDLLRDFHRARNSALEKGE